jgi:hypothetical protein
MMRHRHHPRPTPPPPPTPPPTPPPPPPPAGGYLFRDEFTGPAGATPAAGTSPSSRLWNVRNIGPAGIYGTADSYYTDSTSAVCLDGSAQGNLVIAVGSEATGGASAGTWPTGRLDTAGAAGDSTPDPRFAIKPGMSCEVRAALSSPGSRGAPNGFWPAVWFQGISAGPYPDSWSEVDMVESYGTGYADCSIWLNETTVSGALVNMAGEVVLPTLDSGFHIYRMDCLGSGATCTGIALYLDNAAKPYASATSAQAAAAGRHWPFSSNNGMQIILNVAVNPSGVTPAASDVPAIAMTVDYVRAWAPAGPDPYAA